MKTELILGDCINKMDELEQDSIDTLITDPPAGIDFMGKQWDNLSDHKARTQRGIEVEKVLRKLLSIGLIQDWEAGFLVFTIDWATTAFRVLKPGASGLVWTIPRTSDLTQFGLRLAGFEIRDTIPHLFGSGFPKSHNISRAMDKASGVEGEVIGKQKIDIGIQSGSMHAGRSSKVVEREVRAPATEDSARWKGWGTALKPAHEDWILIQKPCDGTYVENALKWQVAGLNINGSKVPTNDEVTINTFDDGAKPFGGGAGHEYTTRKEKDGRYPANLIHDGSDVIVNQFPNSDSKASDNIKRSPRNKNTVFNPDNCRFNPESDVEEGYDDSGSNARFFYCAKPGKGEKNEGLENIPAEFKPAADFRQNHKEKAEQGLSGNPYGRWEKVSNNHPTVKPIALMEYFVRLTKTPFGGSVIDPFMGSGTTGIACVLNDRDFIGIERDEHYMKIAKARIEHWKNKPRQKELF